MPLCVFIVEIVMKVSNNETIIFIVAVNSNFFNYEDNNEKYPPKHLLE